MQQYHGLLVIDKPGGLTSRDVVNRVQTWFPRRTRLGHMGTLDPLATGVLVLGVGEGTKLTEYVQDMDKVYQAGILLGAVSDSDDADGKVTSVEHAQPPSAAAISRELTALVGEIDQVPPSVSAIKVTGRRAYDLARRGDQVTLAGRKVRIYDIRQLNYSYPRLEIEVRCGKGTYVRSLARDLGKRLGCGGLIASLRRLRVGPFVPEQAVSLATTDTPKLLPLALAVRDLPKLTIDLRQVEQLRSGQGLPWSGPDGVAALFTPGNDLVGLGRIEKAMLWPVRVFR